MDLERGVPARSRRRGGARMVNSIYFGARARWTRRSLPRRARRSGTGRWTARCSTLMGAPASASRWTLIMQSEGGKSNSSSGNDDRSDELLAATLKDSVLSSRWSMASLITKARSALTAGSVVLSLVITGILGFTGLLGGEDLGVFWSPDSPNRGIASLVLSLGTACLVLTSLSIYHSVRALKTIKIRIPIAYQAFTKHDRMDEPINSYMLEAWASLPKKAMFRRIHMAYLRELRSIESHIDAISHHTTLGQKFLLGGLLFGVAASLTALLAPAITSAVPGF